jgi:hypothetical protein
MLNDYNGDTLYLPEQLPEEFREWISSSKENQK